MWAPAEAGCDYLCDELLNGYAAELSVGGAGTRGMIEAAVLRDPCSGLAI